MPATKMKPKDKRSTDSLPQGRSLAPGGSELLLQRRTLCLSEKRMFSLRIASSMPVCTSGVSRQFPHSFPPFRLQEMQEPRAYQYAFLPLSLFLLQ